MNDHRNLMRCALWTEISEAMKLDFPELVVPREAPEFLAVVVKNNADYICELAEKSK